MIVAPSGIVVIVMKSIEDILGDIVLFVFKICIDRCQISQFSTIQLIVSW